MPSARGLLAVAFLGALLLARGQSPLDILGPTEGLIHWWPDPWEAVDRISGQTGVRRGFGPLQPEDPTRFGYSQGWVELGPGITNRAFTVTCWVWNDPRGSVSSGGTAISQDSGLNDHWRVSFAGEKGVHQLIVGGTTSFDPNNLLILGLGWRHLALCVAAPQVHVWVDGKPVGAGQLPVSNHTAPGPLCVGNTALGNSPWNGDLRDLRIYDRVLTDGEIAQLAALPHPPVLLATSGLAAELPAEAVPVTSVQVSLARAADFQPKHYTTDNGLPTSDLQCLYQGPDGTLFIGSEEGLTQFDGIQFRNFDASNPAFAQTSADVICLAGGKDGSLVMGTFEGLVIRRGKSWESFPDLEPAKFLRAVLPNDDGTIWLAGYRDTAPRGRMCLRRFAPASRRTISQVYLPGQIRDLRPAPGGLWIATDEPAALWHFEERTQELSLLVHLAGQPPPRHTGLLGHDHSDPVVRVGPAAIKRGIKVEVWRDSESDWQWTRVPLGPTGGVLIWQRGRTFPFMEWVLAEHSSGSLLTEWIGTPNGLLHQRGERWERILLDSDGPPVVVRQIAPNFEGGIWAGTENDGLFLVTPRLVQTLTRADGLPGEDIQSVVANREGHLFVGLNRPERSFRFAPGPRPTVTLLHEETLELHSVDPEGALWSLAVNSGAVFHRTATARSIYIVVFAGLNLADCSQVLALPNDSLWIISGRGAFQIHQRSKLAVSVDPSQYSAWLTNQPAHVSLRGIVVDSAGHAWIGSDGGGLFRVRDGQVDQFTPDEGVVGINCIPLEQSSDGTLWLGSDTGLGAWREGSFYSLRPSHGLPEPNVFAVKEAEGYLWLIGLRGIHGLRKADVLAFFEGTTNRVSAFTLGLNDGLLTAQCPTDQQPIMAQTPDGRLWIATKRGLSNFDPKEVLAQLRPPPIAITGISAMGLPIVPESRPTRWNLPAGHGQAVEIRFSSISFVSPERVEFEYVLEGGKRPISDRTTVPRAQIPNLGSGSYSFRVSARSGNGLRSVRPAEIQFAIAPHFYETAVFRGTMGVLAVALFSGIIVWRVRRERRLAAVAQARRLASERERIAQDMHDELGASLTRLAWLNTDPKKLATTNPDTGSPSEISTTAAWARDLLRALDETVWTLNPQKDQLDSTVNFLGNWVRNLFANTPVTLHLELPMEVPEAPVSSEWRHQLFRAVKESCANVLKHASATEVRLAIALATPRGPLRVTLQDNGVGFDPASVGEAKTVTPRALGGNGLGNLRRRADALGAKLVIDSAPGRGTRIEFEIPLRPVGDEVTRL